LFLEPDRESEDGSHPFIRDQAIKREKKLHKIGETMGYPIRFVTAGVLNQGAWVCVKSSVYKDRYGTAVTAE
jgi:hypothetical protein